MTRYFLICDRDAGGVCAFVEAETVSLAWEDVSPNLSEVDPETGEYIPVDRAEFAIIPVTAKEWAETVSCDGLFLDPPAWLIEKLDLA